MGLSDYRNLLMGFKKLKRNHIIVGEKDYGKSIKSIKCRAKVLWGCQKVDICTYVRKIISEWITPLESELMEIGGEKAITKASWLLCSPTIITAYRGKVASIGKIEAKNSGQGNLDALLKEYKDAYNVSYNTGIKTVKNIFESFTAQQAYEYIYLYEIRYPERERAFQNFFRKANVDLYLDDILKMKCMTYMLNNESITKKCWNIWVRIMEYILK